MLESSRWVRRWRVRAKDKDAGSVLDFAFDAATSCMRFWFIETGALSGMRDVVVPPEYLRADKSTPGILHTVLTAQELRLFPGFVDAGVTPKPALAGRTPANFWRRLVPPESGERPWLSELDFPWEWSGRARRSPTTPTLRLWTSDELIGYCVQSDCGEIGGLEDILVDLECYTVTYLVVEQWNVERGARCAVPIDSLKGIDEYQRKIRIDGMKAKSSRKDRTLPAALCGKPAIVQAGVVERRREACGSPVLNSIRRRTVVIPPGDDREDPLPRKMAGYMRPGSATHYRKLSGLW